METTRFITLAFSALLVAACGSGGGGTGGGAGTGGKTTNPAAQSECSNACGALADFDTDSPDCLSLCDQVCIDPRCTGGSTTAEPFQNLKLIDCTSQFVNFVKDGATKACPFQ